MAINIGSTTDLTSEMNSTPLIDVMLVLLTMLIITVPLQTHAVKLDLGTGPTRPSPPPVVDLDVDFDGAVLWNGRAVDRQTLDARLQNASRLSPQPVFHVTADRLARYDSVAKVLADAQRVGITQIGFVDMDRY